MNLVDTHAHLNFPDYEDNLDEVINRALKNGVTKIICVSSNIGDSQKAVEIAKKYPGVVYAAVGIHPHQTDFQEKLSPEKQIKKLKKLGQEKQVIAIGECGLDFSPAPPTEKDRRKKEQIFLFKKQIEIACQLNLPLIIHSRQARQEVVEMLVYDTRVLNSPLRGVFHCYSGGKNDIKKVEEIGFYFGVDGNLTYDLGLQNVGKLIPLEKILLETDCPFLSPQPYRGLRNEPKNVKLIAEFLAKLKEVSFEKIAQITTQNTKVLFKI